MVDWHNKIKMQPLVVTLHDFRCVKSHGDGSGRKQVISVPVMAPYYPTALSRVQMTRDTSTNIPRYCTVIFCTVKKPV